MTITDDTGRTPPRDWFAQALQASAARHPERCVEIAHRGEQLGFAELWLAEDCFFIGGIAGATAVLGATKRILGGPREVLSRLG